MTIKNYILPEKILFNAMNQSWQIHYLSCQSKFEMFIRPTQEIVFVGKNQDKKIYKQKLMTWMKKHSGEYLFSQLQNISQSTSMDFTRLTIRDQKTLWGSCTINKSISLNYKLVFLPHHLLQHVIIHELCHTVHMNHSKAFWNKVAEFDPGWHAHKKELRKASQYLPDWI